MRIIDSDLEEIKRFLAPPPEAANVKSAATWADAVIEDMRALPTGRAGLPIHYKDFQDNLAFDAGEVTVWSGHSGHGKSLILNQFILWALLQSRCLIISPEMPAVKTMRRMVYQATRTRSPQEEQVRAFHAYTDDRLWLYDQLGMVKPEMVQAVIRYATDKFKIDHIVVDSLMKCGIGADDYNRQKDFIDSLTVLAKDCNTHIHVVAHSRKKDNESQIPDKHDIKGASEITDMVDNVMIMFRNKSKERAIEEHNSGNSLSTEQLQKAQNAPDAILCCRKQRHGDWEGNIKLSFDLQSMCFMAEKQAPVFVNWVDLLREKTKLVVGA